MESNEIIINDYNVLEERKFLIHTDKYSIGEKEIYMEITEEEA